jgi:hypothetical protein
MFERQEVESAAYQDLARKFFYITNQLLVLGHRAGTGYGQESERKLWVESFIVPDVTGLQLIGPVKGDEQKLLILLEGSFRIFYVLNLRRVRKKKKKKKQIVSDRQERK